MTQTHDTEVVGRAVYLEFIKSGMTTQILLMPEGMCTSHKLVPMTLYRRKISTMQPRKTWRVGAAPVTSGTIIARTPLGEDRTRAVAAEMLTLIRPLLEQVQLNNWKLYKDPIVIDVTREDLEMVRIAKTPHKVMGRIHKVRKALGYPKDFIHPVVSTTPSF